MVNEEQRIQRLERKEMERIAKRFRVITPQEFERSMHAMNEVKANKTGRIDVESWGISGSNGVPGANNVPNTMQGVTNDNGEGISMEGSNTKKRSHEEAFGKQTTQEPSIDEVLNTLK